MRLGYACVNTQLPSAARTARLSNLTGEKIVTLIDANLDALECILRWNLAHGIQVFRLSSNVIPFGSHPANDVPWWDVFGARLAELGRLVRAADMRLSTHPGQYIVLSSAREDVVVAALLGIAGIVLVTLPILLIYLLLQRQIVKGIAAGALKG